MCSLDTEQFIIVTLIVLKETLIDHLLCARCCIYNNKQYEVLPPKNLTKTLIKFQGDTKVFSWNKVKAEIREERPRNNTAALRQDLGSFSRKIYSSIFQFFCLE